MQVWTVARRWSPLTLHFPHRWKTGVGRTGRDDRWCWRREGIIVNLNILWQLLEVTEKGNFTEKGKKCSRDWMNWKHSERDRGQCVREDMCMVPRMLCLCLGNIWDTPSSWASPYWSSPHQVPETEKQFKVFNSNYQIWPTNAAFLAAKQTTQ